MRELSRRYVNNGEKQEGIVMNSPVLFSLFARATGSATRGRRCATSGRLSPRRGPMWHTRAPHTVWDIPRIVLIPESLYYDTLLESILLSLHSLPCVPRPEPAVADTIPVAAKISDDPTAEKDAIRTKTHRRPCTR